MLRASISLALEVIGRWKMNRNGDAIYSKLWGQSSDGTKLVEWCFGPNFEQEKTCELFKANGANNDDWRRVKGWKEGIWEKGKGSARKLSLETCLITT